MEIGGSGPLLCGRAGARHRPSLVVALGKDGNAYLVNSGQPWRDQRAVVLVACFQIAPLGSSRQQPRIGTKPGARYVAFSRQRQHTGGLSALLQTSPPTIDFPIWNVTQNGCGSPFVTSTDGTNNMIVWAVGASGRSAVYMATMEIQALLFMAVGGANELMAGGRNKWSTNRHRCPWAHLHRH